MAIKGNREILRSEVESLLLEEMYESDTYDLLVEDTALDAIVDEGERYEKGLFGNDLTGDDDE